MSGIEATARSWRPTRVVVFLCSTYDVADLPRTWRPAAPAATCTRTFGAERCGGCGGTAIPGLVSGHQRTDPLTTEPWPGWSPSGRFADAPSRSAMFT